MHPDERREASIETVKAETLEFLKDGKACYPREIADAIKCTKRATAHALLILIREGLVARYGKEGYRRYQLSVFPPEQGQLKW